MFYRSTSEVCLDEDKGNAEDKESQMKKEHGDMKIGTESTDAKETLKRQLLLGHLLRLATTGAGFE